MSDFLVEQTKEYDEAEAISFMKVAIEQAKMAAEIGEVPVGAVVVCDGKIVSAEFNTRETGKNALHHAEVKAIDSACKALGGWRLHKCDIYVTLEPCPMCAGAIVNARIKRVIFGAFDKKAGAFGSVINMNDFPLNHKPEIHSGVCVDECSQLLSDFFANLRKTKNS